MSNRSKQTDFYRTVQRAAERAMDAVISRRLADNAANSDEARALLRSRQSIATQIADDLSETYRMMEVADIFEWKM